jgi:gamma-glutamyltranspeptidase/glutathione hydrolase
MAITGKPLAATAGAMMFQKGGNAVDAACAMLAATCTMWDTLSWGGETQALIYNPHTKKVIGINALGVAPTGATAEFYKSKGLQVPARVRSARGGHAGHAGRSDDDARRVRQAVARTCSRRRSDGRRLPDRGAAREHDRAQKKWIKQWKYSPRGDAAARGSGKREAPEPGEIFGSPISPRRCASSSTRSSRR